MNTIRYTRFSLITLVALSIVVLHACKPEPNTTPSATFTISPGFGNTDTIFRFDASGVSDLEDPVELLQVRWDWESDSIFDTEFAITKTITHRFEEGNTYYITVEVKDTKGAAARFTDFVRVVWKNQPPRASFNVTPANGYLQDIFQFDASSVSDAEDKNTTLQVRWDFEGDGVWDTEFSITKTVSHQYDQSGTFNATLEVKDSGGVTTQKIIQIRVGGMNGAPAPPATPSPQHESVDRSTLCLLTWSCLDPEGDELKFDIYFGTNSNPPKVASDIKKYEYACLPLEYETNYYWRVVAKDPYDHVVMGDIWSFRTDAPINPMSTMTDQRDGKVYKTVNINGQIWMAQNLNVGSMIHASTGGDFGDGYQKNNNRPEKFCYNNLAANCDTYGALYQWDEAMNYQSVEAAQGLCPTGWHMPTDIEWRDLSNFYKEQDLAVGDQLILGSRSGFQALFSGYMIFAERKFYDLAQAGYFWSSTPNPNINYMSLGRSVFRGKPDFQQDTFQRVSGLPVRCIKDY